MLKIAKENAVAKTAIFVDRGDNCDFVIGFFTPHASILEDPVTGSAHCSLITFLSIKIKKQKLIAFQILDRVGKLFCEDKENAFILADKLKPTPSATYGQSKIG